MVLLAGAVCLSATPAESHQHGAERGGARAISAGSIAPAPDGPLPSFEPPLLDMMLAPEASQPKDLRVSVKTERFRVGSAGWSVPIIVSVEVADLALLPVEGAGASEDVDLHVDALALVTDAGGRMVAKASRSAVFRGSKRAIGAANAERVTLTCPASSQPLAPGHYTILVGVCDPSSKRGTVVKRTFTLPELPAAGSPTLSSLVLGRRAERASTLGPPDPFVVDGAIRVVSDATGRFVKSRGDQLIVLYRLYGMPGVQYQARVKFLLGDRLVTQTPLATLPAIGASGDVAAAPVIPLDGFAPGAYRAVLQLFAPGSSTPVATSMAPFTIDP
jgi:hypothetical protein